MFRTLFLAGVTVGLAVPAAVADSPKLKGSYGFTGSHACIVAPGKAGSPQTGLYPNAGFNSQLQVNDANLGTNSFHSYTSVIGIRTFNGNGTGTVNGTSVSMAPRPTPGPGSGGIFPAFPPSASSANFSYQFTYTVDGDGGWTSQMVPGTYTSTYTAGPRTGQTDSVDAIPPIAGLISNEAKTLIGAHVAPVVETHTFSNGDVWPMICSRSRVFTKLKD